MADLRVQIDDPRAKWVPDSYGHALVPVWRTGTDPCECGMPDPAEDGRCECCGGKVSVNRDTEVKP